MDEVVECKVFQSLCLWCSVFINHDAYISCFVGNSLWLVAVGYYIYITFLGYSCQLLLLFALCITQLIDLLFITYFLHEHYVEVAQRKISGW